MSNGILDYMHGARRTSNAFDHAAGTGTTERRGRDRADKPEYKVKITCGAVLLANLSTSGILSQLLAGSSTAARRTRRRAARSSPHIDAYLKQNGKYAEKREPKITFQDVAGLPWCW